MVSKKIHPIKKGQTKSEKKGEIRKGPRKLHHWTRNTAPNSMILCTAAMTRTVHHMAAARTVHHMSA